MTSSFASPRALRLLTVASLLFAATTTAAGTVTDELCAQFQAAATKDGQYIFNNNAWGEDSSGAQCTNVIDGGSSFETIWGWTANGNNTHSFPNVQLNTELFPLAMSDLAAMNLQASWSMTPVDNETRANVVYDMFIDPDKDISNSTTLAKYEVMIWIGAFGEPFPLGASVNPFGVVNKTLPSVDVGSTTFTLFSGVNNGSQTVHSWLSTTSNVTDFTGDVTPLITYLTKNDLIESGGFMGILQFGSETWHATANVTFAATSFNLNVTSTDKSANAAASSAVAFAATATASSGSSPSASTSSPSSTESSSSSSSSETGTPSSPSTTSESSSLVIITPTSSSTPSIILTPTSSSFTPTIILTSSSSFTISTSLIPLTSPTSSSSSIETTTIPSLTTTLPGSSSSSSSGSSGSSSSSSSSPSGSSSSTSSSSIISLPFWFWEVAAAGFLFAMI